MSVWLLRGILALAVATAIAQGTAIVLREIPTVAKIEPLPTVEPGTPKPELPGPFPAADPTAEPTPVPTPEPTPPPDIEIDVDLPFIPIVPSPTVTPPPIITLPPLPSIPPLPVCTSPGGSGSSHGKHNGWPGQPRECAGKQ